MDHSRSAQEEREDTRSSPVRHIDMLGRLTLPIDVRRRLDLSDGEALTVSVIDDSIVLRRHQERCVFCGAPTTQNVLGKPVCDSCLKQMPQQRRP